MPKTKDFSISFPVDVPEHRSMHAGGKSDDKWSNGPYVRKHERALWNQLFEEFADEMTTLSGYPEGVVIPAQAVQTLAWNLAYRAIWALRENG